MFVCSLLNVNPLFEIIPLTISYEGSIETSLGISAKWYKRGPKLIHFPPGLK